MPEPRPEVRSVAWTSLDSSAEEGAREVRLKGFH